MAGMSDDERVFDEVGDRDGYPSEAKARLTFADLERCVALAVLDHNLRQNEKTLIAPFAEWTAHSAELPRRDDDPLQVLIAFLPGGERSLTPQGVSFEALDYYAPWLGELVPERDRLGMLEVRGDPRDLSHIYVRHPHTGLFLPAPRRDGRMEPITLWEHKRDRATRRAAGGRTPEMKVALRRAISEIAGAAKRPAKVLRTGSATKSALRAATRSAHAEDADKPYRTMAPDAPAALEHPPREKRALAGGGMVNGDHLFDHVRPWLARPASERIAFIRAARWIAYERALAAHRISAISSRGRRQCGRSA